MLKELVEKRLRLHEQAQAILKKASEEERENLTAEEQQEFDRLHAEMDGLKATIERIQRSDAVEKELAESAKRKTEPNRPAVDPPAGGDPAPSSRQIQASEEDRLLGFRAWLMAGSDLRSSITPQEEEIARRVGFNLGYKQVDIRLSPRPLKRIEEAEKWAPVHTRAQGVATGAGGAFGVPDETMRALEVALLTFGGMRTAASVLRTDSGADLPIPTANDTGQSGMILAENTQVSQQDVVFAQLVLQAFKYSSKMILVSVELLQDNVINLAQFLGTALGTRIGRITNNHFTVGTGSGQPNGIVTASSQGKVGTTGQTLSVIYDDLVDLEHSVDPAYRVGARWMMHDSSLKVVKKLKDSTGRPLWVPGNAGVASMAGSPPDTILGYPIVINQDVPVMAANAKSILFGSLDKYLIRDVTSISLLRLDERFADYHQVAFLAFSRHDGDLLNAGTNPVKHYANSAS